MELKEEKITWSKSSFRPFFALLWLSFAFFADLTALTFASNAFFLHRQIATLIAFYIGESTLVPHLNILLINNPDFFVQYVRISSPRYTPLPTWLIPICEHIHKSFHKMYAYGQTHTKDGKPLYDKDFRLPTEHEMNVTAKLSESRLFDHGSFQVLKHHTRTGDLESYTGPMSMDSAKRFQEKYGGMIQMYDQTRRYRWGILMPFGNAKENLSEYVKLFLVVDNNDNPIDPGADVFPFLR